MAVIKSKGDGYSMYGGVTLPHLPDYDKAKYPYAMLYGEPNDYTLVVSTKQYVRAVGTAPSEGGSFYTVSTLTTSDDCEQTVFVIKDNATWRLVSAETSEYREIQLVRLAWANNEVKGATSTDSQFPAYDIFSLNGMNLIKWDGDTADLEVSPANKNFYLVTDVADIDVTKNVRISTRNPRSLDFAGSTQSFADKGGYYMAASVQYSAEESEGFPAKGVFFLKSAGLQVNVFAYYPIEPTEPEQPEIDRGKLFLLYRIFSPDVFYAITGKKHWAE